MASCAGTKRYLYFTDNTPNDPRVIVQPIDKIHQAIVQPDDILSIHISTESSILDPAQAAIFNEGGVAYNTTPPRSGGGGSAGGNTKGAGGFLVGSDGYIDYPILGRIKVAGLNIRQVKDALTDRLKNYVKSPVAEVSILNYRVTVIGEVNNPGMITAPNHKINIIDAIAASGDLKLTGRRDNVLIIRETEGVREYARLNLNSKEIFRSPYYYLKQNDIVYVEPNSIQKQQGSNFFRIYLPAITTLVSTILAIYGLVQLTKTQN